MSSPSRDFPVTHPILFLWVWLYFCLQPLPSPDSPRIKDSRDLDKGSETVTCVPVTWVQFLSKSLAQTI